MGLTDVVSARRGLGEAMSAGHSLRRQNYSFVTIAPPTAHTAATMHFMRVVVAVVSALALELATFATISMLITGR